MKFVDLLAKNAATDGQILDLPPTHTDIWVSSHLLQCRSTIRGWVNVSDTRNVGQYYFKNFLDPNKVKKPWFSKTKLSRDFVGTISKLRTNHYSLAASLARKNFIESDECPHCGFPGEDINHVLWACPKYYDSRKTLEASLIKLKCFPPFSIEPFLSNPTSKPVYLIFKFLKENNLFI